MFQKIVVVAVFAFLLLLPWVQAALKLLPEPPLTENRALKPIPEWKGSSLQVYLTGWQDWFNDRYPGRVFLIRLKNQLDFSVFRYSDRVYIGKEGWLFYRTTLDNEKRYIQSLSERDIDSLVANLSSFSDLLNRRGIKLVVLDNELKYEFYREKLPYHVSQSPAEPSRYHQFRAKISRLPGIIYIDASSVLHALKTRRDVFHRTDFHWNDPAAFVVAEFLVNTIATDSGRPQAKWRHGLEIEMKQSVGGEAAFMPLLSPLEERALFVKPTWNTTHSGYRTNSPPFEWTFHAAGDGENLLPSSVIVGDSFTDGMMRSGIAEHFVALSRARIHQKPMEEIIGAVPGDAKYFILQFIETNLLAVTRKLDETKLKQP